MHMTPQAISKMVEAGKLSRDGRGRIDWKTAREEVASNTVKETSRANGKAKKRAPKVGTGLAGWKAKLAELEYLERVRKLLDADEVAKATFDAHRRARDRLRLIETRLGPLMPPELLEMLRKEIRDCCRELGPAERR
jgi:hypothetical protein